MVLYRRSDSKRHVPRVAATEVVAGEDKNLAEPSRQLTAKAAVKRRTARGKT